ncbi:hypothetical protein A0H81_12028 [Grifola frondosa]|uniref:Uncharacterized protein n=1 Tax=Grifola frondosa TaxID=5627 RepID=A0A1C7LU27_GRIFR|nr:hypothetical protein A0H81_12028 [Grifola frondosa]
MTSRGHPSRSTLNALIEALQGLTNAAAEAAAAPSNSPPRVKKPKRAEPTPRNAFPHVVENVVIAVGPKCSCDLLAGLLDFERAKQGPIAHAGRKKLPNFRIIGLLTLRSNRYYPSLMQLAKSVPCEVAPRGR